MVNKEAINLYTNAKTLEDLITAFLKTEKIFIPQIKFSGYQDKVVPKFQTKTALLSLDNSPLVGFGNNIIFVEHNAHAFFNFELENFVKDNEINSLLIRIKDYTYIKFDINSRYQALPYERVELRIIDDLLH